jgi:hypothetical protein
MALGNAAQVNPVVERTLGNAEAAGQFIYVDQCVTCSSIPNNERKLSASECDVWEPFVACVDAGEVFSHSLF